MPSRPSRPRAICPDCQGSGCRIDYLTLDLMPCEACEPPPASWRELGRFYAVALVVAAVVCGVLAGLAYALGRGWFA
jgi:hypothetical protein